MKKLDMKKIVVLIILLLAIIISVILVNYNGKINNENVKNIQISIYNNSEELIYEKKIETTKTKLFDALVKIDGLNIELESSEYGEFITSINGVTQEDNYFWNYYINDEYATVGVDSYNIKNNDNFKFVLEKFE